jgi:hypothetical protein
MKFSSHSEENREGKNLRRELLRHYLSIQELENVQMRRDIVKSIKQRRLKLLEHNV